MQFREGSSRERCSVEREEAAEGGGGGERTEARGEASVAAGQVLGELVERVLDRAAQLLE